MNDSLVTVDNVSRKFQRSQNLGNTIGTKNLLRLSAGLRPKGQAKLHKGEFWAVKDVSFVLRRGECLGILGLNGSGKSTLLKLIAGFYLPNKGAITVNGKLDALIELGTGFHPNLSGRENVFVKCSQRGLSKSESLEIYDQVVEFSELKSAIDMPVKKYSSGMYARLGFAVAIFGNPDVLLIDEILSVGDFTFRQKCLDKINEMKRDSAVIFVSHSLGSFKLFCDEGLVLHQGKQSYLGPVDDAVDYYIESEQKEKQNKKKKIATLSKVTDLSTEKSTGVLIGDSPYGALFVNQDKIRDVILKITDINGDEKTDFRRDEKVRLRLSFRLEFDAESLLIGIPIYNTNCVLLSSFSSEIAIGYLDRSKDDLVELELEFDNPFNAGDIQMVLVINNGIETIYRKLLPIINTIDYNAREFGEFRIKHKWRVLKDPK